MQEEMRRIDEMLMKGSISPEEASALKQAILDSQVKKEQVLERLIEATGEGEKKGAYPVLSFLRFIPLALVVGVGIWWVVKEVRDMDRALLFSIVALAVFIITAWQLFFIHLRNQKIRLEERVNEAWASVLAFYQQKVDLLEKAISLAERHAQIERTLLEEIAKLRTKLSNYRNVNLDEVDAGASKLLALVESYPITEFGKDYATVILQIREVEKMLTKARLAYNRAVKVYKVFTKAFPGSIVVREAKEVSYYGA